MPFRIPHSEFRLRTAHTLAELLVAVISGSMLLAAIASTMYIAGQVAYTPVHAQKVLDGTSTAFDLTDELKHATYVVDYGASHIEFVTGDRNGDAVEDTIRYAWSGAAGDPLTKSLNRGTPSTVMESIHHFQLAYGIVSQAEEVDILTSSAEQELDTRHGGISTLWEIRSDQFLAHTVGMSSLPTSAKWWIPTRIEFEAQQRSSTDGQFAVQLRRASSTGQPTSEVLAEVIVDESQIPTSSSWHSVDLPQPSPRISPHERFCVVFEWQGGSEAAEMRVNSMPGALKSSDGGATWTEDTSYGLQVVVHGKALVPDAPLQVAHNRLDIVEVSLQGGDSAFGRIDTAVRLENRPLLAAGIFDTEFESDPTAHDRNGDGEGDFEVVDGGSFDPLTLVDGWWNATDRSTALVGRLTDDTTTPLDVRFRAQATTEGQDGAVLQLDVRLSDTEKGGILVRLWLENGVQTLDAGSYDGSNFVLLGRAEGLPSEPVDVRVVIDPTRRIWAYVINGVPYTSLTLPVYSGSLPAHRALIHDDTSEAQFDYVRATQPTDG